MHIGVIGTIWQSIPPVGYGGTEQVIYNIVQTLAKKGHHVTLFAPLTSTTKATLIPTVTLPLRDHQIPWTDVAFHIYHFSQVFERAKDFDILHMHLNKVADYMTLPWALTSPTPVIFTPHFSIESHKYRYDRYPLLLKYQHLPYTSISYAQRGHTPLNFIENIYNSLAIKDYPFVETPEDYFLWLGKIVPHKGAKEAILAAKKAGVKLVVAGPVDDGIPESITYFKKELQPLIDNKQIIYHGPTQLPEKAQLLGHSKALINSYQWDEPFGLVSIESQATGTPVIITNRGAAKEVVRDGITGFLADSVAEMAEKMHQVQRLSRKSCREFVEEVFSNNRMIEGYLTAYKAAIEHWDTYILQQKQLLEEYKDKPIEI